MTYLLLDFKQQINKQTLHFYIHITAELTSEKKVFTSGCYSSNKQNTTALYLAKHNSAKLTFKKNFYLELQKIMFWDINCTYLYLKGVTFNDYITVLFVIITNTNVVGWYCLFTELQDISVLMDCMYKQAGCLFLVLFVQLVHFLFVVECSPFPLHVAHRITLLL